MLKNRKNSGIILIANKQKIFGVNVVLSIACLFLVSCSTQKTSSPLEQSRPENGNPVTSAPNFKSQLSCANEQAAIVENTGVYGRKISTQSQFAQHYFDQGLRLTFSYYFPEALASFNAGLCFDPDNAMLHWGKALAIAPNPNSRYGRAKDDPQGLGKLALSQAKQLVKNNPNTTTDIEKALIDNLAVLFDTDTYKNREARSQAFITATEKLYTQFPNDLEVAFLAADAIMMATPWQYFSPRDGSPINHGDKAQEILEKAMAIDPNHPGLTHLHIHLLENSPAPQQAEASADRLESLTPKAGHMAHMPGHIYMRIGRYQDAILTNERSLEADKYFAQVWGERRFPQGLTYGLSHRGHAGHASNFIHWAAVLQGNSKRAIPDAKAMADSISEARIKTGGGQRAIANYWMTLKVFSRWQDILGLPAPQPDTPYLLGMWHFVQGSAYVRMNELDKAQASLTALAGIKNTPSLKNFRAVTNSASDLLSIAQHTLAGDIAKSNGDILGAISEYKQGILIQDRLRYMEPPDWLQSTRLSLGQLYLSLKRYLEAEEIFTEDLVLLQENGWALFGLFSSLQGQQKAEQAKAVDTKFKKAWQHADVVLTRAYN